MAFKPHSFVCTHTAHCERSLVCFNLRGAEFQTQIVRLEGDLVNHCAAVTALKEYKTQIRSLALMSAIYCRQMLVIKT